MEPISFIGEQLKKLTEAKVADIGCGAGRYAFLLFQQINNLHLTCIDMNKQMLEKLSNYLKNQGINNFKTIQADADHIPLEDNSMDCILTFNAIHHFDFVKFIKKSAQVIQEDGSIFIYTRLRSQNSRNIWGQYFPLFSEKENRLYELNEMEEWIGSADSLRLEVAKVFRYKRKATLDQLIEKVNARHYSTFSLYEKDELDKAVKTFQKNVRDRFQNTDQIEWVDENIMLVLKPR